MKVWAPDSSAHRQQSFCEPDLQAQLALKTALPTVLAMLFQGAVRAAALPLLLTFTATSAPASLTFVHRDSLQQSVKL